MAHRELDVAVDPTETDSTTATLGFIDIADGGSCLQGTTGHGEGSCVIQLRAGQGACVHIKQKPLQLPPNCPSL